MNSTHQRGAESDMVHTVKAAAANVHGVDVAEKLVRENDDVIYGDLRYLGLPKGQKFRTTGQ